MYDATGVRLQAGRQAEVLWFICASLFNPSSLPPFPFLVLNCFHLGIGFVSLSLSFFIDCV